MKKKTKKSSEHSASDRPAPVGGRADANRRVNWSRVGRQRKIVENNVTEIARTLKAMREDKGISISALAREISVAPATLIKFEERGHAISIAVVNAIAEKLDCSLEVNVTTAS